MFALPGITTCPRYISSSAFFKCEDYMIILACGTVPKCVVMVFATVLSGGISSSKIYSATIMCMPLMFSYPDEINGMSASKILPNLNGMNHAFSINVGEYRITLFYTSGFREMLFAITILSFM